MSMSHDRVEFEVREYLLSQEGVRNALWDALSIRQDLSKSMAAKGQTMKIRCRPSQFARFIILRHVKYGCANNMACLNMKLVPGQPEVEIIDASKNPNRVWDI